MRQDPFEKLKTMEKQWELKIHPERTVPVYRPTDKSLYFFLDKFIEDYSWREKILTNQIDISVFPLNERYEPIIGDQHGKKTYGILRWLSKLNYINLSDNENGSYEVNVLDIDDIYELYNGLHPEIEPAIIKYNFDTGLVQFNNKLIKIRNINKKIFNLLIKNTNERISKSKIWRELGYRDSMKKQSTTDLNGYITNLRQALGANCKEISLKTKEGFLTLHADLEITD